MTPNVASIHGLAIAYAPMVFRNLTNNRYAGEPSKELDAAWNDLMAPMHIRVTAEELQQDNQESVQLKEGGGYLGWLGVFHELHCIVSSLCFRAREIDGMTDIVS